jgi:phosphatidylglycerophosphate synthase
MGIVNNTDTLAILSGGFYFIRKKERLYMKSKGRVFADLLTWLRVLISLIVIFLSLYFGREVLHLILWLTLVAWTTDSLDGPIARSSKTFVKSWIGERDHRVDSLFALSLLFYLVVTGFVSIVPGIIMGTIFALSLLFQSKSLFQTYMALVYGSTILTAFLNVKLLGFLLSIYAILNMILDWRRFKREVISFIEGFESLGQDWLKKLSSLIL